MKKTVVILSAVIMILLVVVGILVYLRGSEDTWICEREGWAKHGNPSLPMPVEPCGTRNATGTSQTGSVPNGDENPELIGGQKDEHGCLIGAGYDWCESKQKCLRAWEEDCPSAAKTEKNGIIEGSLSYPSEFIPSDMKVCAENVKTKDLICTTEQIKNKKYTYGTGYRLEVPAGTYRVFASLTDAGEIGSALGNDYRAYYSEFVTCGLAYGCPSHTPINVTVTSGQMSSKIDPMDWYK